MTVLKIQDHIWYRNLRRDFPSEDECWVWDGAMQVNAGEFWRKQGGAKRVSIRPYLVACIVGTGKVADYEPGWSAGPMCQDECVNPRHAVRDAVGRPTEAGVIGDGGRKSLQSLSNALPMSFSYLQSLVNAVWPVLDPSTRGSMEAYTSIKAAQKLFKFPVITSHWKAVERVCALMIVSDEELDLLRVIEASGFVIKDGTIPVRYRAALPSIPRGDARWETEALPFDRAGSGESPPPVGSRTVRRTSGRRTPRVNSGKA